jgi:RNA polymerase sigma factor (TIGR02999 family)
MEGPLTVEELLANAKPGDDETISRLLPLVYSELKLLAANYLDRPGGHTLQPTALVHEAYLKLVGPDKVWNGRDHFFATAAVAMRQVLVDHARRKSAAKRGGGLPRAGVDVADLGAGVQDVHVIELDELLTALAKLDPRAARVAEMRLFGGLEQDRIAAVLGISRVTVVNDWRFARAWLAGKVRHDGA